MEATDLDTSVRTRIPAQSGGTPGALLAPFTLLNSLAAKLTPATEHEGPSLLYLVMPLRIL